MSNSNTKSANKQNEFIYFPEAVGTRYFTETFFFYLGSASHDYNWLDDLNRSVCSLVNRIRDFARDWDELAAVYAEGR
jgi:hypothetical protein